MTTYKQDMKNFLEPKSTNDLIHTFVEYFDLDYFAIKLIKHLERTTTGRKELRKFIIKTLSDEKRYTLSELEEMFYGGN